MVETEDWIHTLIYVLMSAKKEYVMDQPLGEYPTPEASRDVINVFISRKNDFSVVKSIMLSSWIECYINTLNNSVPSKLSRHWKFDMSILHHVFPTIIYYVLGHYFTL